MTSPQFLVLVVMTTAILAPQSTEAALRQSYGGWCYHPGGDYTYVMLYYKPEPAYTGYDSQYFVYFPNQPRYVYFYDRTAKQYWGRYDIEGKEGARCSVLAEQDRKGQLVEIPETAYPEPGPMPPLPESMDGVTLAPPPHEIPAAQVEERRLARERAEAGE